MTVKTPSPTRNNHVCYRPIRGPYTPVTCPIASPAGSLLSYSGLPDRNYLDDRAKGKDPDKVRIVLE